MDKTDRETISAGLESIGQKLSDVKLLTNSKSSSVSLEYMSQHQLQLHEIVVKKYNLMLIVLAAAISSATFVLQKQWVSYTVALFVATILGVLIFETFRGAWKMLVRIGSVQILAKRNAQSYRDLLWATDVMDPSIFTTIPTITMIAALTIVGLWGYMASFLVLSKITAIRREYADIVALIVAFLAAGIAAWRIRYRVLPELSKASHENVAHVQEEVTADLINQYEEIKNEYQSIRRLLNDVSSTTKKDADEIRELAEDVDRSIDGMEATISQAKEYLPTTA